MTQFRILTLYCYMYRQKGFILFILYVRHDCVRIENKLGELKTQIAHLLVIYSEAQTFGRKECY